MQRRKVLGIGAASATMLVEDFSASDAPNDDNTNEDHEHAQKDNDTNNKEAAAPSPATPRTHTASKPGIYRVLKRINISGWSSEECNSVSDMFKLLAKFEELTPAKGRSFLSVSSASNFITVYSATTQSAFLNVLCEYAPLGSLSAFTETSTTAPRHLLLSNNAAPSSSLRLTDAQVLTWFSQVALGLRDVHEMGFPHCDVSADNVFVMLRDATKHEQLVRSQQGDEKLASILHGEAANSPANTFLKLGLPRPRKLQMQRISGVRKQSPASASRLDFPPESLESGCFLDTASDLWSLGKFLSFLLDIGCEESESVASSPHHAARRRSPKIQKLVDDLTHPSPLQRVRLDDVVRRVDKMLMTMRVNKSDTIVETRQQGEKSRTTAANGQTANKDVNCDDSGDDDSVDDEAEGFYKEIRRNKKQQKEKTTSYHYQHQQDQHRDHLGGTQFDAKENAEAKGQQQQQHTAHTAARGSDDFVQRKSMTLQEARNRRQQEKEKSAVRHDDNNNGESEPTRADVAATHDGDGDDVNAWKRRQDTRMKELEAAKMKTAAAAAAKNNVNTQQPKQQQQEKHQGHRDQMNISMPEWMPDPDVRSVQQRRQRSQQRQQTTAADANSPFPQQQQPSPNYQQQRNHEPSPPQRGRSHENTGSNISPRGGSDPRFNAVPSSNLDNDGSSTTSSDAEHPHQYRYDYAAKNSWEEEEALKNDDISLRRFAFAFSSPSGQQRSNDGQQHPSSPHSPLLPATARGRRSDYDNNNNNNTKQQQRARSSSPQQQHSAQGSPRGLAATTSGAGGANSRNNNNNNNHNAKPSTAHHDLRVVPKHMRQKALQEMDLERRRRQDEYVTQRRDRLEQRVVEQRLHEERQRQHREHMRQIRKGRSSNHLGPRSKSFAAATTTVGGSEATSTAASTPQEKEAEVDVHAATTTATTSTGFQIFMKRGGEQVVLDERGEEHVAAGHNDDHKTQEEEEEIEQEQEHEETDEKQEEQTQVKTQQESSSHKGFFWEPFPQHHGKRKKAPVNLGSPPFQLKSQLRATADEETARNVSAAEEARKKQQQVRVEIYCDAAATAECGEEEPSPNSHAEVPRQQQLPIPTPMHTSTTTTATTTAPTATNTSTKHDTSCEDANAFVVHTAPSATSTASSTATEVSSSQNTSGVNNGEKRDEEEENGDEASLPPTEEDFEHVKGSDDGDNQQVKMKPQDANQKRPDDNATHDQHHDSNHSDIRAATDDKGDTDAAADAVNSNNVSMTQLGMLEWNIDLLHQSLEQLLTDPDVCADLKAVIDDFARCTVKQRSDVRNNLSLVKAVHAVILGRAAGSAAAEAAVPAGEDAEEEEEKRQQLEDEAWAAVPLVCQLVALQGSVYMYHEFAAATDVSGGANGGRSID